MVFSYNWLQSFFKTKLPEPKKLAELLTLHSFEVEGIIKAGQDRVFNIDITPNRPDCFAHIGVAKECSAITGVTIKEIKDNIKEGRSSIKDFIKLEVKDENCSRYVGRLILGVKPDLSPKYVQERLKACGLEPINNIVDAANYVMLETGQPLHVFDLDKIANKNKFDHKFSRIKKIIVRRGKRGEKIEALDDKTYDLDEKVLVIADEEKPLAIAGIKGGKAAAIDKNTKNIFIESANFDSVAIRKASQQLVLKTDASYRFEHGINPELAEFAINRLVSLIQKTGGGEAAKGKVDHYSQKPKPKKIIFNINYLNQLLGTDISGPKAMAILNSLQIKTKVRTKGNLESEIPLNRQDLIFQEDLIEEVARIYGYQNIVPNFPVAALIPAEKNREIVWENKIKDLLKEEKFIETYNHSFVSKKIGDSCGGKIVSLKNPFSKELYYLRPTLLFNILLNVEKNLRHSQSAKKIKIFEVGKIFSKNSNKVIEKKSLAGAVYGEEQDFLLLKGTIESFLQSLGISDIYYDEFLATSEESPQALWNSASAAEIKISGKEVGFFGEISQDFLKKIGIPNKVLGFEIDLDLLIKFVEEEKEYLPISKYPSAVRDIAVLVPRSVKVGEAMEVIYTAGGPLIYDVDLFDIYEGEQLPEGKKNLAFHIIFQPKNKTLSSNEVDSLQNKIIKALEKNPEWEVRK